MTHGIDTDFLVAAEIRGHPFHPQVDSNLRSLLADGHDFALAPQILAEFIHIVTDARRMPQPLTMADAISGAEHWWQANATRLRGLLVVRQRPSAEDVGVWAAPTGLEHGGWRATQRRSALPGAGIVRPFGAGDPDAGGITAGSRRLSEGRATPPDLWPPCASTPAGVPECEGAAAPWSEVA